MGYPPPKRLPGTKRQTRLNLRRSKPPPDPEEEIEKRQTGNFWRWVAIVALFHAAAIAVAIWIYRNEPAPPPPEQFISLLPEGQAVKGTPGTQAAPKIGQTTPAPSVHATPPPAPAAAQTAPVKPKPVIIKPEAPETAEVKPPKPAVKLTKADLSLAEGPATDKPAKPKPKKKPVDATLNANTPDSETTGLSKEEIAARLGQKLEQTGAANQVNVGQDGSEHSQANPYQDFYLMIHDQVMSKWQHPDLEDETAVNPVVQIHVEKDGRVPPELVTLQQSSGNQAYDQSALDAARSLGYLLQPLPDGCPPDISIHFNLTR
ncbi:MAG: TonB C-terminal domain-containing protein [Methylacidiphilales bacterium]|nr:TonB C-terminal domain-containing protein [Candidatus Methylacidiphilales bacterium]